MKTHGQMESWDQVNWAISWRSLSIREAQCVYFAQLNREVRLLRTANQGDRGYGVQPNRGGRLSISVQQPSSGQNHPGG